MCVCVYMCECVEFVCVCVCFGVCVISIYLDGSHSLSEGGEQLLC